MANKIKFYQTKKHQSGFSLIELLISIGIFAIIASGVIYVVIHSYRTYYGVGDRQVVVQFAQEGLEAVKSIRDNAWQSIVDVSDGSNKGVVKTNNLWGFSGSNNTLGALTRVIVIDDVSRDASGVIGAGTDDPNTKKVTVTVSGSGISNYVLVSYITNWSSRYWEQTDWSGVGAREFWNNMAMASSAYSNISTTTPGSVTLSLSAGGTPGSFGDWGTITALATSTYFSGQIVSMALSPDQKTLYTVGADTPQHFRAYDVSQASSGIIKELWRINYYSDVMVTQAAGIAVHPSGRYVYVGCYATTGVTGRLILIIDTQTQEVNFSTGGTAGGTTMYINDIVVDSTNGYVYGLGRNGKIFPFQMTDNGATLTLVGDTAGQIMAASGLNEGIIHNNWLYITTSDGAKAFQKINISNPAALATTTAGGYAFPGPSSGRRYGIMYLETSGDYPRFLVTGSNSSYEAEVIQDEGTSCRTLGGVGLNGSSHYDVVDGGLGARTYFAYGYNGDLQEFYVNSSGVPTITGSVCNGRACKYANYIYNAAASAAYYSENLVYSSVLGGLILLEYRNTTPATYQMYFVPRSETRATGATYSYRRAITIDHTKVSNTDQSSFPVLISGTYSYLKTTGNGGNLQSSDGNDIIFTSDLAGDTILDFEIENYSSTTGALTAWVRVPTLSAASDTTIYMFYGNASVTTSQARASSVWNGNFKFVAHMNAQGSTDAAIYDSSLDQNSLYKYSGDPSTIDIPVSASSDDAQEKLSDGTVTTNAAPLYLSYQNASNIFYTGLRFQNVGVPQGADIISAYLEFQASTTGSTAGAINNAIAAVATDDASTFTTTGYSISSLTTTTAFVTWRWPYTWTTGALYRTNDISPIVREIVSRPGWASGNDMAFRIRPDASNNVTRAAKSYDSAPWTSTSSPRLYIKFASTTSGKVDRGQYFDNNGDKYLAYANYISLWQNASDFTAEFWIKYAGGMPSAYYSCILYKGNGDAGVQEGWYIRFVASSGKLAFHMGNNGKNLGGVNMTNALSAGTWTYIAMVVDRDVGYQWYLNGAAEASFATNTTAYTALGTSTALGLSWDWSPSDPTMSFLGNIDEVRLSHTARSSDWLLTSYNSQNNPSTFYSIADAVSVAGYASPGTFYSSIIQLGATDQTLSSISVNQNVPSGCSLVLTLEGSDVAGFSSGVVSQDFSDSSTSFFTSSTPTSLNSKYYLRYKVTMTNCNSGAAAPTLYSLRLNYR